jgi:hypothetical protein
MVLATMNRLCPTARLALPVQVAGDVRSMSVIYPDHHSDANVFAAFAALFDGFVSIRHSKKPGRDLSS